jgi:phenylpyruvate tautomerase PptA (4-oxalocrotonate tautomerase family)
VWNNTYRPVCSDAKHMPVFRINGTTKQNTTEQKTNIINPVLLALCRVVNKQATFIQAFFIPS